MDGTSMTPVDLNDHVDDDCVQFLTPEGGRRSHPAYPCDPDPDDLRRLYRDMVTTRRLDAEGVTLQRQGELGLWIPSLGQEAAQVGSARAMGTSDYAFPSYREHAVAFCLGLRPLDLMRLFRGVAHS